MNIDSPWVQCGAELAVPRPLLLVQGGGRGKRRCWERHWNIAGQERWQDKETRGKVKDFKCLGPCHVSSRHQPPKCHARRGWETYYFVKTLFGIIELTIVSCCQALLSQHFAMWTYIVWRRMLWKGFNLGMMIFFIANPKISIFGISANNKIGFLYNWCRPSNILLVTFHMNTAFFLLLSYQDPLK